MTVPIRVSQVARPGSTGVRWLALFLLAVLVAACASERGLETDTSITDAVEEAVRPASEANEFAVAPRPAPPPIVPTRCAPEA